VTAPAAVRVRVPATSANLGPAFDCAGLALTRYDLVEVAVTGGGLSVSVAGEGAGELPEDGTHLVVRAFRAACDELGWSPPGLSLRARNEIPQGRGMGSSAAAVAAGVVAAWVLCPDRVRPRDPRDDPAVLRLATELEGHPDNVAACLLGGATLSWMGADGARAARVEVDPRVLPVLLVPEATLSTHLARTLLPATVPHADAARAAGRSALLVHALARDPFLLLEATEDRLHQRQRGAAMPHSLELLDRLRGEGHAAVVSGAGPCLLVLTQRSPQDPAGDPARAVRVREVASLVPAGWRVLPLGVDPTGARVLPSGPAVSSA
jgi:homoserine kinase